MVIRHEALARMVISHEALARIDALVAGWVRAGHRAGLRVVYDTRPIRDLASPGTHDREAQITAYAGPSAGWHLWPSWTREDTQLCTFSDPTDWGGDLDVCGYVAEGDPPYYWLGAGWEREDGILGDIDDALRLAGGINA